MSDIPDRREAEEVDTDGWKAAASEFVRARLDLIGLEAKEAAQVAAKKAAVGVIAAIAAFFAWMLICAGLIGWIAAAHPDWAWFWIALVMAGVHVLVILIAVIKLRAKEQPPFPITRSQLVKDKEWLESLKQKKKS